MIISAPAVQAQPDHRLRRPRPAPAGTRPAARPAPAAARNSPTAPPHATATASGVRAACAAISSAPTRPAPAPRCRSSSAQDLRPFGRIQDLDLPGPGGRVGGQRGQHPAEPVRDGPHGHLVEQVGGRHQPTRAARRAAAPRRGPRPGSASRSNRAAPGPGRDAGGPHAGQARARPRGVVLHREHDLEQRVPGQGPVRGQRRRPAARTARPGAPARPARTPATRPSSWVNSGSPDTSVRRTSVLTKNPTRSSRAASVRPGDRGPDRDVGARAQPGQQHGQRGLHHHEQRHALLTGQAGEPLGAPRPGARSGTRAPAVAGHRRARPVGRQGQLRRRPGQRVPPARQPGRTAGCPGRPSSPSSSRCQRA